MTETDRESPGLRPHHLAAPSGKKGVWKTWCSRLTLVSPMPGHFCSSSTDAPKAFPSEPKRPVSEAASVRFTPLTVVTTSATRVLWSPSASLPMRASAPLLW
uniref:Uncharacterized protein n=1 Tax=Alexandrium catenella TaxID=2925 RepID=A0A7S1W3Z0_ALECA